MLHWDVFTARFGQALKSRCNVDAVSVDSLQSRRLHADTGFAEEGRALVDDHAKGEVGEDWGQGRQPWPVCHLRIRGILRLADQLNGESARQRDHVLQLDSTALVADPPTQSLFSHYFLGDLGLPP